ncbi:hypothetical protein BY996DRAFT_6535316 [Phakopsora pachyrhizi]|nr:hypothetical protein BY996DRAFT_6535316 [Phakopsora pachyrhizi]
MLMRLRRVPVVELGWPIKLVSAEELDDTSAAEQLLADEKIEVFELLESVC